MQNKSDLNLAIEVTINPMIMTPQENQLLFSILQKNPQVLFFKKNTKFETIWNHQYYQVQLTHEIMRRHRKCDQTDERFEIIGDKLIGKGAYAKVYNIEGTLKPDILDVIETPTLVRTNKNRVINISKASEKSSTITPHHLHASKTVILDMVYMVMPYFPGELLYDVIDLFWKRKRLLSPENLIEISILLLKALQEQVHDQGIVHRDLKPENIMLDIGQGIVTIFDFNLCKRKDEQKSESVGTIEYISPEQIQNQFTNEKADIFAMGIVLSKLWKLYATYHDIAGDEHKLDALLKNGVIFDKRSFDKTSLNPALLNEVYDTIVAMVRKKAAVRLDLEQAIYAFEKIRMNFVDPDQKIAFEAAFECRKDHRKLFAEKSTMTIAMMRGLIQKHIEGLNDPSAIRQFVLTLGIHLLKTASTQAEVFQRIDDLDNSYKAGRLELKHYETVLNGLFITTVDQPIKRILSDMLKKIRIVFGKEEKETHKHGLDQIVIILAKIKRINAEVKTIAMKNPVIDAHMIAYDKDVSQKKDPMVRKNHSFDHQPAQSMRFFKRRNLCSTVDLDFLDLIESSLPQTS